MLLNYEQLLIYIMQFFLIAFSSLSKKRICNMSYPVNLMCNAKYKNLFFTFAPLFKTIYIQ
jgi:hypothetical protein